MVEINNLKHDSCCFKLSYCYHATIMFSAYNFIHIADNMTFIFYWTQMVIRKHKGLFVLKKQVFRLIIIGNSA